MMADRQLQCAVVTPEKSLLEAVADQVVVPAHDGEVGILPGHARFLAKLGAGECRVTTQGKVTRLFVDGGFVQVAEDRVTILTDMACAVEEIDLVGAKDRVEAARKTGDGTALAEATRRLNAMERAKKRG